ncbi:MAG: IPTL-CTERM sorting domain-containing protein [Betaproteobacteria bacterium]|nr:IPTL-CTERM sorting domain-containing protein [Betaproteobacteria bacterium]
MRAKFFWFLLSVVLFSTGAKVAQAQSSWATFAYSGFAADCGGSCDTQLQLATNTGPVTLTATNRGWVSSTGSNNGSSATNSYIAGFCSSTDSCTGGNTLWRNWFAFALPVGGFATISSATLLLDVPAPTAPPQGVYNFGGTLTYTVWDVSSAPATFTSSAAGLAEYTDIGTGTAYGSRVYVRADEGTVTSVPLNAAALAWLNTQIGQTVVVGGAADLAPYGAIPTLSPAALALLALLVMVAAVLVRRRSRG